MLFILLFFSFLLTKVNSSFNLVADLFRDAFPQIIGHAGASYYVPESSLIGYDLAANLLADYSEPDLILTKDKYFIANHDLTLEGTTNVMDFPEYASRVSTFNIEGKDITGIYAINFTLAEIQRLTIRQRFINRSTLYNWKFGMPTLDEIIDWQISHYNISNRLVGILPELKHPDWYNEMGYPMEDLFLNVLKTRGYHVDKEDMDTPTDLTKVLPIAIQCFKSSALKYMTMKTNIPLIQLIGISDQYPTPSSVWNEKILDDIKLYAQAVGPDKNLFTSNMNTSIAKAIQMASWAHERDLAIMSWSYQPEAIYIPKQFNNDEVSELNFYYGCLGVTAVFHEAPDLARQALISCDSNNCRNLCKDVKIDM